VVDLPRCLAVIEALREIAQAVRGERCDGRTHSGDCRDVILCERACAALALGRPYPHVLGWALTPAQIRPGPGL